MYLKTGCDNGFYGENCTKCSDNCLNGNCQFQIGHCFGCKDGFKGEMCEKGMTFFNFKDCTYASIAFFNITLILSSIPFSLHHRFLLNESLYV